MDIQFGFYYHIKDTFFAEIQDNSLMANKEDGNYRPHYLTIQDSYNPQIYWMVPVSSKFKKYQNIYNHQVAGIKNVQNRIRQMRWLGCGFSNPECFPDHVKLF